MLTKQEIFNRVATHLLTQRAKAMDEGRCRYLDRQGRRCAVGCLIPDGHPSLTVFASLGFLLITYPDLAEGWGLDEDAFSLLNELQLIHDNDMPSQWAAHLTELASKFNLSVPDIVTHELENTR